MDREKKKPHIHAVISDSWCRLAELNCPFSITIAAYYHYTKAAMPIYHTKNQTEINILKGSSVPRIPC